VQGHAYELSKMNGWKNRTGGRDKISARRARKGQWGEIIELIWVERERHRGGRKNVRIVIEASAVEDALAVGMEAGERRRVKSSSILRELKSPVRSG
jgi:hypothetical protein